MRTAQPDKRTRLIETATKLAYGRGFRETSLADIAEEVRAARAEWDRSSSPKERLLAFVSSIQANRERLARGGCPLGSLCSELHREGGALAKKSAALFTEPIGWLEKQFRAAGHDRDSRELAIHLFSSFQGMAAVAHGTNEPDLVLMEVRRHKNWINTL